MASESVNQASFDLAFAALHELGAAERPVEGQVLGAGDLPLDVIMAITE